MPVHKRRELEVKFRLGDDLSDSQSIEKKLTAAGFKYIDSRIETDFLPDTANGDCKQKQLLFRIREVVTKQSRLMLMTLKLRNLSSMLLIGIIRSAL